MSSKLIFRLTETHEINKKDFFARWLIWQPQWHFLLISLCLSDIFNQHFLHIWLVFSWLSLELRDVAPTPKWDLQTKFFVFSLTSHWNFLSYAKLTISIAINVPKACLIMNELTSNGTKKEKKFLYWPIWMTIYNKLCWSDLFDREPRDLLLWSIY